MKLDKVRVVIRQKLFVGNYEALEPEVELSASLDPGDDPARCLAELHKMLQPVWAKQALSELGWVAMRRKTSADKLQEYVQLTAGTRSQLKTMV